MRKKTNLIFVLIVVLVIGFFGYREISKRLTNANLQRQIKTLSKSSSASKSDFKNTAKAVTLTADGRKDFEVGKDIEPGIYDISTTSNAVVFASILLKKETPSKNILLSKGQKVNISESGDITLMPSKIEPLKLEENAGEKFYTIPAQGFYYEGSQLPVGKYEVVTENLPIREKNSKTTVEMQDVSAGPAQFSKEGYIEAQNVKNINARVGKQEKIIFNLKKNQLFYVSYSLPPENLKVMLKVLD